MKRFANTFLLCPVAFGAGTLARVPNEMGRPATAGPSSIRTLGHMT
jgi:hypothetical protein